MGKKSKKPPRYPICPGDERNPIAKTPFLIVELKRQLAERDRQTVEALIAETARDVEGSPNQGGSGQ